MASPNQLLLVDFDNTITLGDSLDAVIRTFSPSKRWMAWQDDWLAGRMGTRECLERQIGDLRVGRDALQAWLAGVRIDPGFADLQQWAREAGAKLIVVSDNFAPIVHMILRHQGIVAPRIHANDLAFEGERLVPGFPYFDPACPSSCAHCKSVHYARYPGYRTIYVGDGRSDLCAAPRADLVFAKDRLAEGLGALGKPYRPYRGLAEVARALRGELEPSLGGLPPVPAGQALDR